MSRLRHPATCVVAVGLAAAGAALAGPVGVGVVAGGLLSGVGGDMLSDVAGRGWDRTCDSVFGRTATLNHDLQRAYKDAFIRAIGQLENDWFEKHHRGRQQRRAGEDGSAKALFSDLNREAKALLDGDWLSRMEQDEAAFRDLRAGGPASTAFDAVLDEFLVGEDPQLVDYLHKELPRQFNAFFQEELKRNDDDGVKARTAYQLLIFDQMLSNQATILAELRQRGEAGAELLDRWDAIAGKLEEQRDQLRQLLRETEDRIVERVLAGFDERLAGRVVAEPEIHSRIWNVPHAWNRFFVGRGHLLDRLHDGFAAGTGSVALTQSIQGLGGVGKTQLAVQFAYKHSADYEGVWWLRAESPVTLAADYAKLAVRLELPAAATQDQDAMVAAVRAHLEATADTGERWLLVFDNAVPGPDGRALTPYLPTRGRCDVLITSREKAWSHIAEPYDVDLFTEPEAVAFLTERTEQDDAEAARALAEALGYLPLALEQAGAFIRENEHTLAGYLERYRRKPFDLAGREANLTGEYGENVATTWLISFDEVERRSPAAADLLRLCAFLAPDSIPLEALVTHAEALPEPLASTLHDPDDASDAVSLLLRLSLADAGEARTINVHRLVQLVTREWLSDEDRSTWAGAAARIMAEAFQFDQNDPATWEPCRPLSDHALAAVNHAEAVSVARPYSGALLNEVGRYLSTQRQTEAAFEAAKHALEIAEAVFGSNHPKVATNLNNLAGVLRDLGDSAAARPLLLRALRINEALNDPDQQNVAATLSNLAMVLHDLDESAAAHPLLKRALAIQEVAYGPDHHSVAITLNSLAMVLQDLDDPKSALPLLQRALRINETAFSPDHPAVAVTLSNLAMVLQSLDGPMSARPLLERALAIDETAYGPNHPNIARDLNHMARLLQNLDGPAAARPLFQRALAIDEAAFLPDHPAIARDLTNLATALRDLGESADARPLLKRAFNIYSARHDPIAVRIAGVLAVDAESAGQFAEAARWLRELLAIYQAGPTTRTEGVCFYRLARFALTLQRPKASLHLLGVCYTIDRRLGHPDAEAQNLPAITALAAQLDIDEPQLRELLAEVERAYLTDRGQGIITTAFPELDAA